MSRSGYTRWHGDYLKQGSFMDLSPEARLVFLLIGTFADEHGYLHCPSKRRLCAFLELPRPWVDQALAELESAEDARVEFQQDEARYFIPDLDKFRGKQTHQQARWAERKRRQRERERAAQ